MLRGHFHHDRGWLLSVGWGVLVAGGRLRGERKQSYRCHQGEYHARVCDLFSTVASHTPPPPNQKSRAHLGRLTGMPRLEELSFLSPACLAGTSSWQSSSSRWTFRSPCPWETCPGSSSPRPRHCLSRGPRRYDDDAMFPARRQLSGARPGGTLGLEKKKKNSGFSGPGCVQDQQVFRINSGGCCTREEATGYATFTTSSMDKETNNSIHKSSAFQARTASAFLDYKQPREWIAVYYLPASQALLRSNTTIPASLVLLRLRASRLNS